VYTEEEWNDEAVEDIKKNGKASNGLMGYMASKTLAERGAMVFTQSLSSVDSRSVHFSCLGNLP